MESLGAGLDRWLNGRRLADLVAQGPDLTTLRQWTLRIRSCRFVQVDYFAVAEDPLSYGQGVWEASHTARHTQRPASRICSWPLNNSALPKLDEACLGKLPASLKLMNLTDYAYNLGSLLANFQSLELGLRAFLQQLPDARPLGIPYGEDIYSFPAGQAVPESELTSYDSLGRLIDKYNEAARDQGLAEIDHGLVDIRDALAHGRVECRPSSPAIPCG